MSPGADEAQADSMCFDMAAADPVRTNRLLTALVTPRPIAWVVTVSASGVRNAAPFSFFNVMSSWPPVLVIGIAPRADGGPKDTRVNCEQTGEFVVNLVSGGVASSMNQTSVACAPDIDELEVAGLATHTSVHVRPPRIAASPVAFECRVRDIVDLGTGRAILIGDILAIHVLREVVLDVADGRIDAPKLDLIARLHGRGWYLRSTDRFEIARPPPP
jgi:flavin reductase (DIM6/NTAB) family NADH-FMN oxidoreductase RutF